MPLPWLGSWGVVRCFVGHDEGLGEKEGRDVQVGVEYRDIARFEVQIATD